MITIQDLYNIVGNKIANEAQKALIRNNFPPQIAEQMCNAIEGQERAEHFQRLLREYNEWMQNQQRQQEAVQRFLREHFMGFQHLRLAVPKGGSPAVRRTQSGISRARRVD